MRSSFFIFVLSWMISFPAAAGPFMDKFSACLVGSSSPRDNILLVRWFATAILSHGALSDLPPVSAAQGEEVDRALARYMTRVMTLDCKQEFLEARRYEGEEVMRQAFEFVGRA